MRSQAGRWSPEAGVRRPTNSSLQSLDSCLRSPASRHNRHNPFRPHDCRKFLKSIGLQKRNYLSDGSLCLVRYAFTASAGGRAIRRGEPASISCRSDEFVAPAVLRLSACPSLQATTYASYSIECDKWARFFRLHRLVGADWSASVRSNGFDRCPLALHADANITKERIRRT